jgi:hypothetical protein
VTRVVRGAQTAALVGVVAWLDLLDTALDCAIATVAGVASQVHSGDDRLEQTYNFRSSLCLPSAVRRQPDSAVRVGP